VVPEPYNTMFAPGAVDGFRRAASVEAEMALHPLMRYGITHSRKRSFVPGAEGRVSEFTEADFRQIKATYYGMIAEVDAQLGRVIEALRAAGAWHDTFIVFTSDHAEMLGDHYELGKGGFFDESQHVPLLIRDPARPAAHGRQVRAFTEAVDVFPTLAELTATAPRHHLDGTSLLPFLSGETPAGWRDAAHWEFDFREISTQMPERALGLTSTQLTMTAIRGKRWKYVHFTALPPLLFDLEADPDNLMNLAGKPEYAAIQLEMAEKLLSWRTEHLDHTLALKDLTPRGVVTQSSLR
jgi:arylsulfatase A-like enzyme